MMKPYIHNPDIFRKHYVGRALPAFQGQRMQYGASPFNLIRRIAAPLLYNGIKLAAPHLAGSAGKLAQLAMKKVFPKQHGMQKIVGNVVKAGTQAAVNKIAGGKVQKKRKLKFHDTTRAKHARATRKRNIF